MHEQARDLLPNQEDRRVPPTSNLSILRQAAHAFVGAAGVRFRSTTGEKVTATQGWSKDSYTPTIAFQAATSDGSACLACWGYRRSCKDRSSGNSRDVRQQRNCDEGKSRNPGYALGLWGGVPLGGIAGGVCSASSNR
jgi:hypothetical protein